ncbi:hypothetical protein CPB85DRAFT_1249847 [Mucidula mucida]|nr:hypothetical protein CPB85DRAFT_1249847 [Mucidula mucida]
MAPKRSSSRTLNTQTKTTTRSRLSASVASTGTRRSARLGGGHTSETAPAEEPAAESSAINDAPAETATLAVINEGSDDEAPSSPEAVEVQQQFEDNDRPSATEAAPPHHYDNPLYELSYPEGDPDTTESQEIEASSSLPLQPTIYDYLGLAHPLPSPKQDVVLSVPEKTQSGAPSTSQLHDQLPTAQSRPIRTTAAVALSKRFTKFRKTLDDEVDSDDSSDSEVEAEPDAEAEADAPEASNSPQRYYATDMGPEVDGTGAPYWYAPAKGQAWAFYQQRKDIAHCAKLFPHREMVVKNIEASCLRERLFQDRLLVYFTEYMAEHAGEGETVPQAAPFFSSKDMYGVTVSEVKEEMERNIAEAEEKQSSSEPQTSTGTKRSREEEEDVESERQPRRQKSTR